MKQEMRYLLSTLALIVLCFTNIKVYAGSWKTKVLCEETVNGRKFTETLHYDSIKNQKRYSYTILDVSEKVKSIKDSLYSFDNGGQYTEPRWMDYQLYKGETIDLCRLAYNVFFPNRKNLSDTQLNILLNFMCTNDGMVCCWEITADSSLLDIFTTEEIVLVFNKLSQFRYTSPLVRFPEKCWQNFSLFVYQRFIK